MADITTLILDDHETFRRWFAQLDERDDPNELTRVWETVAELLDLHAAAEEAVFYPELVRFVHARHEENAAVGYAELTGCPAACVPTAGPGAVHIRNGLYDAEMDKVPVVAITGGPSTM